MAVLKIHVIRQRLDHRLSYVMNAEKTAHQGFHSFFGIKDTLTSGFNCACDEAYQIMHNLQQINAVALTENYQVLISAPVSVDEMKKIIDSIY